MKRPRRRGRGMPGYLTPSELDLEHWRWVRWKPQHGGWNQPLWIVLQETWRKAVTAWFEEVGYE